MIATTKWFRVFDGETLKHICDFGCTGEEPRHYDPRIGGSGNVIWQEIPSAKIQAEMDAWNDHAEAAGQHGPIHQD